MNVNELANELTRQRNQKDQVTVLYLTIGSNGVTKLDELLKKLASAHEHVLLLNANLRKSNENAAYFPMSVNKPKFLIDRMEPNEVWKSLLPFHYKQIFYLNLYLSNENKAISILLDDGIAKLLEELKRKFELIIVYSSSILQFVDAHILTARFSQVIADVSTSSSKQESARLLECINDNCPYLIGKIEL